MTNFNPAPAKNTFRGNFAKIALGLLFAILALLAAAHLVLERHCTALARRQILPWLQARYQADVQLENISVNLLSGVLVVEGATLGNPPGFASMTMAQLPHFRLRLALHDLWRKNTITIRSLRIKDASLNIIRNPQGDLNLAGPVAGADQPVGPDQPDRPDRPSQPARPAGREDPPRLALDKARIHTRVKYIDHNPIFQPEPLCLEFDLKISTANLANYGRPEQLTGTLMVDGEIIAGSRRTALELRGRFAPVIDPRQLTFELTGSTKPFDLTDAPPLAGWLGVEQGLVACTATLTVKNNVLDPAKSMLKFNFSEARLAPATRQRLHGIALPRVFTMSIPLSGNLEAPRADFTAAIASLLTSDDVISSFLEGLYKAAGQAGADAAAQTPAVTP